ncbi:MAG: DUF2116 family Zn-ribbon domain-containing protein [Thermoplasmata archaeon]
MAKVKLADGVPVHKHCLTCQNPIPIKNDFCSTDCKEAYEGKVSKNKMWLYIWLGLMVLVILLMFVLPNFL